jgi:hypothetical protein
VRSNPTWVWGISFKKHRNNANAIGNLTCLSIGKYAHSIFTLNYNSAINRTRSPVRYATLAELAKPDLRQLACIRV